jgi:hypothetical protein
MISFILQHLNVSLVFICIPDACCARIFQQVLRSGGPNIHNCQSEFLGRKRAATVVVAITRTDINIHCVQGESFSSPNSEWNRRKSTRPSLTLSMRRACCTAHPRLLRACSFYSWRALLLKNDTYYFFLMRYPRRGGFSLLSKYTSLRPMGLDAGVWRSRLAGRHSRFIKTGGVKELLALDERFSNDHYQVIALI